MLGMDLNSFWDGLGHTSWGPMAGVNECILSEGKWYIWFRGGDLNSVLGIKPHANWRCWGITWGGSTVHLIIRSNNIYGLVVGICMVSEILSLMWTGGNGAYPLGTLVQMSLYASYHNEQQYMRFRGWALNSIWDIKPFMKGGGGGG